MKTVVVVPTNRPKDWDNILKNIKRQTLRPDIFIAVENGQDFSWTSEATITVNSEENAGLARQKGLEVLRDKYPNSFFVFMDGDDYYGPSYIQEAYNNRNNGDVIGKHAVFYRFNATGVIGIVSGKENEEATIIQGPTMAGHTRQALDFEECNGWGEDIEWQRRMVQAGRKIYATSRFNFCGYRSIDTNDHTWTVPDIVASKTMGVYNVLSNENEAFEDIINNNVEAKYSKAKSFALNI